MYVSTGLVGFAVGTVIYIGGVATLLESNKKIISAQELEQISRMEDPCAALRSYLRSKQAQ